MNFPHRRETLDIIIHLTDNKSKRLGVVRMRKVLFLLLSVLLTGLVACGNEEEVQPAEQNTNDEMTEQEETEESDSHNVIEDVMEFLDNPQTDVSFEEDGVDTYLIKEVYINKETGDVVSAIDFDGYEYQYAFALLEQDGIESLGLFSYSVNNTEESIQFNNEFEIVTDEGDQVEPMQTMGLNKPNAKKKQFNAMDLEYDTPKSFEATLQYPLKEIGDSEFETYGDEEEMEMSFTLE